MKTVGRGVERPSLTVDAHRELRADYYLLAHRVGTTTVRLIGYAPRWFVANSPTCEGRDGSYHWVPRDYLFPLHRHCRSKRPAEDFTGKPESHTNDGTAETRRCP